MRVNAREITSKKISLETKVLFCVGMHVFTYIRKLSANHNSQSFSVSIYLESRNRFTMLPIIWLGICLFFGGTRCQSRDLETVVDELVNSGTTAKGIPGLSLAVVDKGAVILAKGYGVKDVVTKQPADADTLFGLASNTKAFTTAVLAKLLRKHPA